MASKKASSKAVMVATSDMSQQLDESSLLVLTYNICFGCMIQNSDLDITGKTVAKLCTQNNCINNLMGTIDRVEREYKHNLDFVGLQEASRGLEIAQKYVALQKMLYVHCKDGFEESIIFYNPAKFILNATKCGTIKNRGRPYIILFLTKLDDGQSYICINMHNDHHVSKNDLETYLSKNIANCHKIQGRPGNINHLESLPTENISDLIRGIEHNVIVMGDTNDHGMDYWKMLQPFSRTGIDSLSGIIVKCTEPPITCCQNTSSLNAHSLYGDYILVSDNINFIIPNEVPGWFEKNYTKFPVSDHWPVIAGLRPAKSLTSSMNNMSLQSIKLKKGLSETSRLQNDLTDPTTNSVLNKAFFQGYNISNANNLIFPNGNITSNGLVLIQQVNHPGYIGYVRSEYIIKNAKNELFLNGQKTLRLQDNITDPNDKNVVRGGYLNTFFFKGGTIQNGEQIKYPDGTPTSNNLVVVQVADNINIFGYVKLESLNIQSGGQRKYNSSKKKTKRKLKLKQNAKHNRKNKTINRK